MPPLRPLVAPSSVEPSGRSRPLSPRSCRLCWIPSTARSPQARVDLAAAESARTAVTAELGELRRQETALRDRLAGLTESVHGLELQIHEKRLHVASLLERVASELGLDEDILISEYGPDQDDTR